MARSAEMDLSLQVEANLSRLEKQMARADAIAAKGFNSMQRRAEQASQRMEKSVTGATTKITSSLKALGAGIVGGLAIGGIDQIIGRMSDLATSVANIGNEARRANLSTKAFQELSHVATQTRIPLDALIDGFKELSIRGDEFAQTGKGSGEEAFKRLGYSAADLSRKLQDPSALFLEIIGRMEKLDAASNVRIADEVFGGTGGEQFVELLRLGESGIRDMIKEANDFGLVMDDAMIAKADEVDRKFKLITTTVGTGLKRAIVDAADALDGFFDQFRKIEEQQTRTVQLKLSSIYADRQDVVAQLADLETEKASSFFPKLVDQQIAIARGELERLTKEAEKLRNLLDERQGYTDTFVYTGETAKDAAPKVSTLATSVSGLQDAGATGAAGIKTFADAVRALKGEIPGLTEQLADLDARARIDTAYKAALQTARSIGDTLTAERLRDQALADLSAKPARDAANKGMLDLIGYAEGTDKGRGYNETLGYGKFTGGNRNLVTMTLDEVLAMQKQMLAHPDNKFNSSAVGRYQIVSKTLKGLMGTLGLKGTERFDATMQDRLAQELLRQRGNDPAGLRNEWEGLRRVDSGTISKAYDGESVSMPAVDPGLAASRQEASDKAKDQAAAYAEIIAGAKQFTSEQTLEQTALGMTAQKAQALRYEQSLLNDAQRAGIELTPAQRQELTNLANGMAEVEAATLKASQSQEQMQAVQGFLKGQIGGFFSDIITGSMSVEDALNRVLASLADAALQAALFGEGPLGSLFGGGILSIFGFAKGGIAAGGKPQPLPRFAKGGVARSASIFGEAGPEAAVPLPDGRRIPVDLNMARTPRDTGTGGNVVQNVTVAPTITINSPQGGDPKQNDDLARKTSAAVEASVRGIVQQELRSMKRQGMR